MVCGFKAFGFVTLATLSSINLASPIEDDKNPSNFKNLGDVNVESINVESFNGDINIIIHCHFHGDDPRCKDDATSPSSSSSTRTSTTSTGDREAEPQTDEKTVDDSADDEGKNYESELIQRQAL